MKRKDALWGRRGNVTKCDRDDRDQRDQRDASDDDADSDFSSVFSVSKVSSVATKSQNHKITKSQGVGWCDKV